MVKMAYLPKKIAGHFESKFFAARENEGDFLREFYFPAFFFFVVGKWQKKTIFKK